MKKIWKCIVNMEAIVFLDKSLGLRLSFLIIRFITRRKFILEFGVEVQKLNFFVAVFSKKGQILQLFLQIYRNERALWKIWLRGVEKNTNLSLVSIGFVYIIRSEWENQTFESFFMSFLRLARKTLEIKISLLINIVQRLFYNRVSS